MSMYRICGESQKGKSHEANGTVCQDSCFFEEGTGFVIAAVADGLGSSKHSDIASRAAAQGAVRLCMKTIRKGMSDDEILSTIKTAFDSTNFAIKQEAGDNLDDYDTTLTLAVFMAGDVYYGHAGDSGIVALRSDGRFEEVTEPQLGSGYGKERPVYPLAAEEHWVFAKYEHQAKALFFMTDGVLNKVVPPLLENEEYKIDHAYLFYLYDNLLKNVNLDKWISGELEKILPQEINYDDKTLLAVVCGAVKCKAQHPKYYEYPTEAFWKSLLDKHNKSLYGYKNNDPADTSDIPDTPAKTPVIQEKTLFVTHERVIRDDDPQQSVPVKKKRRGLRRFVIMSIPGFVVGVLASIIVILAINAIKGWSKKPDADAKPPSAGVETHEPSSEPAAPDSSLAPSPSSSGLLSVENRKGGSVERKYEERGIDLSKIDELFAVDENAGERTYTMEGGTGAGKVDENGLLTVTKAGNFTIGLETAATKTHKAGAKVTATLTVKKGAPPPPPQGLTWEDTTPNASDGKITGLLAEISYECIKDNGDPQKKTSTIDGEIIGLEAGSYKLRIAETPMFEAGEYSELITIK